MFIPILNDFGLAGTQCTVTPFGSGLINHTWRVTDSEDKTYILQQLNATVFPQPFRIAENISRLSDYLQAQHPGYIFPGQVHTLQGPALWHDGRKAYYRLMPFIGPSVAYDVVESPEQAYEAAKQFGRFTRLLSDFPTNDLHITLEGFHDLGARYVQFENALQQGNPARIENATQAIAQIKAQRSLADAYDQIRHDREFRLRVTHHDTKISNVLFDPENKGLCVIDLDTVMPGYFISDLGDMLRTYLSPVSEEEKDLGKIQVREAYFMAVIKGYVSEMRESLTDTERRHLVYAGQFMTYMQALRFLTDYLHNDRYYGARYEGHNLVRAQNQLELLRQLTERETELQEMAAGIFR